MLSVNIFDWESHLRQWSQQRLEKLNQKQKAELPLAILESGWLGYPGATDYEMMQFVFNNPDLIV